MARNNAALEQNVAVYMIQPCDRPMLNDDLNFLIEIRCNNGTQDISTTIKILVIQKQREPVIGIIAYVSRQPICLYDIATSSCCKIQVPVIIRCSCTLEGKKLMALTRISCTNKISIGSPSAIHNRRNVTVTNRFGVIQ